MTTDDLTRRASRLLADYIKSGRTRTDLLKECATAIVDLRSQHTLDDGRVDWSGRSTAYRAEIRKVYAAAKVPADVLDTVQQALRYHVGNLLRERADAGALEQVGLSSTSPRGRLSRQREVVAALSTNGSVAEVLNDPIRLIAHAEALLDYIDEGGLAALGAKERTAARASLEGLVERAERLAGLVAKRPRGGKPAV